MRKRIVRVLLRLPACLMLAMPVIDAQARSPVTHRTTKDFRALIVQGERPEIAACMVAALGRMRTDPKFDAIRWNEDDSETAIMRETEDGNHIRRDVRFDAQVRERARGIFSETWLKARVVCEHREEESPEVQLTVSGK